MRPACAASKSSLGLCDVLDSEGGRKAAQMLDLRTGVQNVTCVREREIKRKVSFLPLSALRLAVLFSLARVSDVLDGHAKPGSIDAAAALLSGARP